MSHYPDSIHVERPGFEDLGSSYSRFDVALGPFDGAWQKLWLRNDVFDEILGCSVHLTLP